MGVENVLMVLALVFGFYMAWSVGANDVANAMGTSVGSGALTLRRAVIVAAVLEFAGAFLVGSHVSETVRKGIIDPQIFASDPLALAYGMIAALLAAGGWLQLASYYGWPVSTTHSIVGAIIGFGVVAGGFGAVHWAKVGAIVASWVVSPLISGTISFLIFSHLRKKIYFAANPVAVAKKMTPWLVFIVIAILSLVLVFKGLKNLKLDLPLSQALAVAGAAGLVAAITSHFLVRRIDAEEPHEPRHGIQPAQVLISLIKAIKHLERAKREATGEFRHRTARVLDEVTALAQTAESDHKKKGNGDAIKDVERIFAYLQIMSACFVAFAHGANDVANAIGPLAAAIAILRTGIVAFEASVPLWALALGGLGIVVGLATWGWRVIETVGKKITELTPTRGFAAEFGAATTIVFASKLGLPISTTHTLVGAVLGVGLARGIGALNLQTIRDIIISWIVTIPAGALSAILFFYVLRGIFG